MGSHVMAVDVGTSAIHCLLADSLGRPIGTASAPMHYTTPEGCPALAKEFDPDAVIETVGRLTGELLEEQAISPADIGAIGVTGQRQGVVFLDDKGNELYSGPNIDLRAIFEGAAIDEELGGEIYATTGHFPALLLAPARLRWFRENRPQTHEKVSSILTVAGWLAYKLTGSLVSQASLDGEAGLLDINKKERSPHLMEKLGVDPSLLPPLSPGDMPCGPLSARVAAQWGLRAGIPVVSAGPDTQCGLLGMGLVEGGKVGAVIGWSGALQAITANPCHDGGMRTWAGCYLAGLWVAESNIGDVGGAYRWLRDILLGRDAPFEQAEQLAGQASASDGVMAFLGPGPVSSLKAGLRMGGLFFPTPLIFQETTHGQLFRAALESIACSVKANLDTLGEVTGSEIRTLHLGGGMANSRILAAGLANLLGFPVERSVFPQVSARGAALAAASFSDSSVTLAERAMGATDLREHVEPGTASEIAQCQEWYGEWLSLYERLQWDGQLAS